jgi:hypothetical protein
MGIFTRARVPAGDLNDPNQVAQDAAGGVDGNRIAAVVSAIALVFSAYSLWETSLKQPDLSVFVPPVIQYAAPYQNSNFEMIAIPVTISNEGARTGTVLSLELAVTDPRTKQSKLFYAADLGNWSMERTRAGAYQPFAPISLAGRASRTETILFYTRGKEQKPDQIIREIGPYSFTLRLEQAAVEDFGWLDRLWRAEPPSVSFERSLPFYDARAFNNGTIAMSAPDWRSATSAGRSR